MITSHDLLHNALLIGMDFHSACLYAGLSEDELLADDVQMAKWKSVQKQVEFGLLEKLDKIIDKQMNMGKEAAVTWMLERVNPERWSTKANVSDELPDVHIHLNPTATFDDVEMSK